MKEKASKLEEDLVKAQSDLKQSKIALAKTFDDGFGRAKGQVLHFCPEVDLSGLDPYKILVDGKLVDEE